MIVLHGNKVDWKTLHHLALGLPNLEEIHLSNNGLGNPDGSFRHENVRQLFLTCNEITSFDAVQDHLGAGCPRLELLSLGENPLTTIPCSTGGFNQLNSLNLNITKVNIQFFLPYSLGIIVLFVTEATQYCVHCSRRAPANKKKLSHSPIKE